MLFFDRSRKPQVIKNGVKDRNDEEHENRRGKQAKDNTRRQGNEHLSLRTGLRKQWNKRVVIWLPLN